MDILAKATETEFTEIGEIPIGFLSGSIKNIGDSDALVNGIILVPGQAKGYPFVGKGYEAIAFDPQGSTLSVLEIS